jgi:hypothetical protein
VYSVVDKVEALTNNHACCICPSDDSHGASSSPLTIDHLGRSVFGLVGSFGMSNGCTVLVNAKLK